MKKVFGIFALVALLALPAAAYAAAGHDSPSVPIVNVETPSSGAVIAINEKLGDNNTLLVSNPTPASRSEPVITEEKLPESLRGAEITPVAALPTLTVTTGSEDSVSVLVVVESTNFADKNADDVKLFLEHRTEGQPLIQVPYDADGNDADISYAFFDDAGENPSSVATGASKNLLIRNLKYDGDYNKAYGSGSSPAVSFVAGQTIKFDAEFLEVASDDDGGGCDAGLSPLALLALAGVAFVSKKKD